MKYLTTILLCLGISRSGWAQSFTSCGCSSLASLQLIAAPSCCENIGNSQYGNSYGPLGVCCNNNPCRSLGLKLCGSQCPQPVICPYLSRYSGCPISVQPYSPCQKNPEGSCVLCRPCCPFLQQYMPGSVSVCPCPRTCCQSITCRSVSIPQPICSCCSAPICSPVSSPPSSCCSTPITTCCSVPNLSPPSSCCSTPITTCCSVPNLSPPSSCCSTPITTCCSVPNLSPSSSCCSGPVSSCCSGPVRACCSQPVSLCCSGFPLISCPPQQNYKCGGKGQGKNEGSKSEDFGYPNNGGCCCNGYGNNGPDCFRPCNTGCCKLLSSCVCSPIYAPCCCGYQCPPPCQYPNNGPAYEQQVSAPSAAVRISESENGKLSNQGKAKSSKMTRRSEYSRKSRNSEQ